MPREITGKAPIYNHKSLEDRLEAARRLQTEIDYPGEIVCDSMKNEAAKRYRGMPQRLYIVQDGFVVYHGGKGPFGYNLKEVEDWLEKRALGSANVSIRMQEDLMAKLGSAASQAKGKSGASA
jgi:hypothetical protein